MLGADGLHDRAPLGVREPDEQAVAARMSERTAAELRRHFVTS